MIPDDEIEKKRWMYFYCIVVWFIFLNSTTHCGLFFLEEVNNFWIYNLMNLFYKNNEFNKFDRYKVFTCTILFVIILIIASLQYSSVNPRETQTFPCMSRELI